MDADKQKFVEKSVEILDHLHKLGWVESYILGPRGPAIRWTNRGERCIAALHFIDSELTISGSYWPILLTLIDSASLDLGRQIIEVAVAELWTLGRLVLVDTLYKDKLFEITDQEMVFRRYYFPFGNAKHVPLAQIESIQSKQPSLLTGSWRIWGTGDFATWFPLDFGRPSRDRIFFAALRGSSQRIGFTVEDSQKLTEILRQRGLLQEPSA